jgi:hypothetical protein
LPGPVLKECKWVKNLLIGKRRKSERRKEVKENISQILDQLLHNQVISLEPRGGVSGGIFP